MATWGLQGKGCAQRLAPSKSRNGKPFLTTGNWCLPGSHLKSWHGIRSLLRFRTLQHSQSLSLIRIPQHYIPSNTADGMVQSRAHAPCHDLHHVHFSLFNFMCTMMHSCNSQHQGIVLLHEKRSSTFHGSHILQIKLEN